MKYSLYKIFLDDTIELARSMVIKLDCFAKAMNRKLVHLGHEIPSDKKKWRYYLHLSGEYHHLDTPMTITSLDDASQIVFNKENLKVHKKTRSVYLYDRTYPDTLKQLYPEQTNLVGGILRPLDIDTTVNAKDGSILLWNDKYVERQEYSLIQELEEFVYKFLYRTNLEALHESDELYAADMASKLYSFLVVRILDIRNKYVRSSQTHSFHITAFLASHQGLDKYVPFLTYDQLQFLYRNLLYVEKHAGMQYTFDTLVQHILSARHLPINSYSLRQKDMDVNESLYPTPIFVKEQLNLKTGLVSRDLDIWDIDHVLYKTGNLTPDNHSKYEHYLDEAIKLTSTSSVSDLPSKILEVSAIDPEDIAPIKLIDVLINEWLHQASVGIYTTRLDIINPINGDSISLDTRTMFLLFIYAQTAGFHGIHLKEIPLFIAKNVLRKRWIDAKELLAVVEPLNFDGWEDSINFFAKTHPITFDEPVTPEQFFNQATELMNRQRVRHQFAFQPHRNYMRAGRIAMYDYNYIDVFCNLKSSMIQTFDDLFVYMSLDRKLMSNEAWRALAIEALDKATQFDTMSTIGIKQIQAALVKLMRQLSSYTVQYIEEIIGSEAIVTDPLCAIPGDTLEENEGEANLLDLHVSVYDTQMYSLSEFPAIKEPITIIDHDLEEDRTFDTYLHVKATAEEMTEVYFDSVGTGVTVQSTTINNLTV